ncbi:uncharacterized protein OCT59_019675 [Rhizophagus irregularis]|uniref:uncharacterized protein n=1 Tax=Rhizophagus irregularis TaxID=588596 RepID=UPI0019FF2BB1|nr:hypothetical protein OCT59_019675 [Rhizophagus irregularis]GET56173.1 hypothetical protein GLOIN_2v1843153 [Rhizophagus irregularis DAOM 181602=DAOM 197198]
MMDSEQNNEPISEPLKTPREKNSTPSSDNPSLVRYRNLGYNILKSLDDKAVRDIDFPELEPCSECNNDILTFPLREFTRLRCGHIFHRLCAEKKLMLTAICKNNGPPLLRSFIRIHTQSYAVIRTRA